MAKNKWLIALNFVLLILSTCSRGYKLGKRKRRESPFMTCGDAVPKNLPVDLAEGTEVIDMNNFVYQGTPHGYRITNYKFNQLAYHISGGGGFNCSTKPFADARRFLCMRDNGKVEIRRGSGFRNIAPGSQIDVVIRPYSADNLDIDVCTFILRIGFKPTLTPMPTTASTATTTTKATTKPTTTTKTTISTTTKKPRTTVIATTTVSPTRLKTKPSSTNRQTERGSTDDIITLPTIDPCFETKMLQGKIKSCRPRSMELSTIVTNQSLQSIFEYKIDETVSTPILKTASVKVRTTAAYLPINSSIKVKLFFTDGETRSLLTIVDVIVDEEQAVVTVDKFIKSTGSSSISVEIERNDERVNLPGGMVSLVVDLYDFCQNDTCLQHYEEWLSIFERGKCQKLLKGISIAQFDTCFAVCPNEKTNAPSTNDTYEWPLTFPIATVTLPCRSGIGNASRICRKTGNQIPKWGPADFKNCRSVNEKRSQALKSLSEVVINAKNASKASAELRNITRSNPKTIPASQLNSVTNILEELSVFASDEKVANDMLDTVDNCMEASEESLLEGQKTNNVSKRMVTLLSTVCGALLKNRTEFTMSKKGFALAGSRENKSSFKGLSISYKPPSRHNSASTISIDKASNKIPNDPLASIQLPKTLLTSHGNDQNDLIFVAYDHGKLFQEKGRSKLNSKVISAEVKDAKISDLGEPIVTKFKTSNDSQSVEQICVWWDFDLHDGAGGWSTRGCSLLKAKDGYAECHCNHLTNFAVLLGAKMPKKNTTHQIVLTLISYIGIGISLAGTLFTLISYIIFPKLRDNAPPKILMNLCAALIFLQAIFLIGIERTSPRQGCQAVAFLLQYVLLCVLSWSGVEGFFSYRGIVMPMKSEVQNLMFKASMFGWVVPIVFPVLGIAIWPQNYGDERSCAVMGMPMYTTVIAPVALVMVLNAFSIISIMAALNKSSKMYPHNAINSWHRLRIIVAFVLLFSLTWFFGFFVIANNIVAFQYIFCILNSLQGFFLFVFYGVRNENVRKSWLEKFQNYRERRALSSSAGTKKTDSSFDSVTYNKSDSLRSNSMRKSKDMDNQFQVHLTARANVYAAAPSV